MVRKSLYEEYKLTLDNYKNEIEISKYDSDPDLLLGDIKIKPTSHYKYLGLWLDD